jgi:hypothetical protein
LDLARIIPKGAGRPGARIRCTLTYQSGEVIVADLTLAERTGAMELSFSGRSQSLLLLPSPRHLGARQWYAVCPRSGKPARVLYRPLGASHFASRHGWGRRAAYASQFLNPVDRAWRIKHKVKMRLIGTEDPDEWDLPPKPKGMRWATYEQLVDRYEAEEMLDAHIAQALARLLKRR